MAEGTCSRESCDRPAHCKGLCKSHYTLHRRNHPDRPRCRIVGCHRARCARGLCAHHYQRERLAEAPERRREARRRSMAKWRATHPEAAREAMRRWIEANPERWNDLRRARDLTRRARKTGTQTEPVDLAVVLAEHGMTCHICTDDIGSLDDLHFDHVIPLARGGTHTYDNLRPAHATCNLRKGAAMPA